MNLTRFSDYSLRILIYLAARPDRLATIEEIARDYRISKAHLMKVANGLGRAGFLETVRGRGGGLRLARRSDEILVGDVVRLAEGPIELVECFAEAGSLCRIEPACRLRGVFEEALDAFLATLDGYTIADLVHRRRSALVGLLNAST